LETRRLGRTDLTVSAVSLGTEYLVEASRETVVGVVRRAVESGVNYLDALFAYPRYRDNLGAALRGLRERVLIAGHLGPAEKDGQFRMTRGVDECRALLEDLLVRLGTDHVDVVFLSNCDEPDDYEQVFGPGGLSDLARRLVEEGKARFIGFSCHRPGVALKAVRSGLIDVLMYPINLSGDGEAGRRELFGACAAADVGLIGMKPFAGGALLGEADGRPPATPVQCLAYALSQPGVSAVVPGVKNTRELEADLAVLDAPAEERDFAEALRNHGRGARGRCVYCNHCLPCPTGIDVGKTLRLLDTAEQAAAASLAEQYRALPAPASECLECGACTERCPFGVDVIPRMRRAVEVFEPPRA